MTDRTPGDFVRIALVNCCIVGMVVFWYLSTHEKYPTPGQPDYMACCLRKQKDSPEECCRQLAEHQYKSECFIHCSGLSCKHPDEEEKSCQRQLSTFPMASQR